MTKSKLSHWCDSLLELSWLLAVIIAPLFFNIHSERVFEPDKITLIRSLAVFMIAVWGIKFINEQSWQQLDWLRWSNKQSIWRTPLALPILALILIYVLSSLFSVTPYVSWLGSYQRLQGTYTTFSYIIIFVLMAAHIRTNAQMRRVATAVIITSIPVALYGMLQRFGLDPLPWGGNTQTRIAGHMGNAIFVAAYLIMAVPLTLSRILAAFTNILSDEELNFADIIRSSIYIFTLAIQLIAIYWSGSRGPLLGLLIGVFVFITIFLVALRNNSGDQKAYTVRDFIASTFGLITVVAGFFLAVALRPQLGDSTSLVLFLGLVGLAVLAVFVLIALRKGWKWLWLSWILLTGAVGIWLVAFNVSADWQASGNNSNAVQTLTAWRELPGVGRYGSLLDADSNTGRVRVFIWEGTIDLVTPHEPIEYPGGTQDRFNFIRPLFGYGPESMYVAYNRFYPPQLATVEARNASPDRAHNETWDALVITGLLGFLAWQWLYLSVFYYGFKWLGVVRRPRDRNILIGLWVLGGVLMALFFASWQGASYIGVALPFGSIIGLVAYLIYYALTASPLADTAESNPFRPDRLMMIALLGAIVAYYVEIHFGIAIVATRVHFFVYAGLLLVMGHILPQAAQPATADSPDPTPNHNKTRRARGARSARTSRTGYPAWLRPVLLWSFLLAVMIAILGYNFTIFTPPPDLVIQSMADLPSAGEIFYQSFFINPRNEFADSPFLFLLMMMTWLLGSLIALSEMVKSGTLTLPKLVASQPKQAKPVGYLLLAFAAGCIILFLTGWLGDTAAWTTSQRIGYLTLAPLGALLAAQGGVPLILGRANAPLSASAVAVMGLAFVLPLFIAGATLYGFILLAISTAVLVLLWGNETRQLAIPTATIPFLSLAIGLSFCILHANRIRASMIQPGGITAETAETVRRVAEATQFASILTLFYVFLFSMILLFGWLAILPRLQKTAAWGTTAGFVALLLLPVAFFTISHSNLQVIQADMVYKRGKPWDSQAPSAAQQDASAGIRLWDNAIEIYREALDLAPTEDFYYLWLGRAFLEKSSLLNSDPAARDLILQTAQDSLFSAQELNPLNTDHTANLARLNTRWASVTSGEDKDGHYEDARQFYRDAIALSPQNAVIRNEYARMTYSFEQDCDEALDLYQESADADPYYYRTRFEIAEIYIVCGRTQDETTRINNYGKILDQLREGSVLGLERPGRDSRTIASQTPRAWLQAAQYYQENEAWSFALRAYEALRDWPSDLVAEWQVEFFIATAHNELGNTAEARATAAQALDLAPPEAAPQIQQFLDGLEG